MLDVGHDGNLADKLSWQHKQMKREQLARHISGELIEGAVYVLAGV